MKIPKQDIKEILEWIEFDEKKNYIEGGKPKNHIYTHVLKVREWLDKEK